MLDSYCCKWNLANLKASQESALRAPRTYTSLATECHVTQNREVKSSFFRSNFKGNRPDLAIVSAKIRGCVPYWSPMRLQPSPEKKGMNR